MAIDLQELEKHIADYNRVTGNKSDRFVCPITLRQCEIRELIDGHVLNAALRKASRRTVIQYREVDNFYGHRVEPTLVRYLNKKGKSRIDLIKETKDLRVSFPDGSEVPAFLADSKSARRARRKFPLVTLRKKDWPDINLYVKTHHEDLRLTGPVDLVYSENFYPPHWVAALLKAGHLALFEMIGYASVFDPFGDSIRRELNRFYFDNAKSVEAGKYFSSFRNAVKILLVGGTQPDELKPYQFDTLNDREFLLHHTPRGKVFAATCLFQVNDVTVTITLPQSTSNPDVAVAVEFYDRMTKHGESVPQTVHRARIVNGSCTVEERPLPISYSLPGRA